MAWMNPGKWQDPTDNFKYFQYTKEVNWPPTWHLTGVKDDLLGHINDIKTFIKETNNTEAKLTLLGKVDGAKVDYDHINSHYRESTSSFG